VFVVPPEGSTDDTQHGGVALVRAFHYVKSKANGVKALSFITDVSKTAEHISDTQNKMFCNLTIQPLSCLCCFQNDVSIFS